MALNFDYTCPIIDENINEFYYEISYFLNELVKGYYLHTDEKKEESIDWHVGKIYEVFKDKFEGVRTSNKMMRRAADNQLDELETDLKAVETEKERLGEKVDELETEKTELETEKTELEEQLEKLETKIEGLEDEITEFNEMLYYTKK